MPERRLWIFDWDGTLVDSLGRIELCMQLAIADCGLPGRDSASIRNIIGLGLQEALHALFPGIQPAQQRQLREVYAEHFVQQDAEPCAFHDGAMTLLQQLREHGDLLAVATGKSRRGLDRALGAYGLQGFFDATRCADESVSKPAPDMVLELLQLTGADARWAVVVGDTEYDLAMASAAGVHRLGVCFGAHTPERLQRHAPLACVGHLAELLEWRHAVKG